MSFGLLLGFLVLPVMLYTANDRLGRARLPGFALYVLTCFLCYGFLMLSVIAAEYELKQKLERLDPNHDGIFTGAEITREVKEAIANVSNDTGRAFAPITGIPYTIIWVGAGFIATRYWLHRRRQPATRRNFVVERLLSF